MNDHFHAIRNCNKVFTHLHTSITRNNTNIFQINFQSLYSIQKFNKNEIGKASIVNHTLSICHRQIKFGHDNKN